MDFQDAQGLLDELETHPTTDDLFCGLKTGFLEAAVRYAHIRAEWALADVEKRRGANEERGRAHDAFIDRCNMLGRYMAKEGADVSWREKLGHDRKDLGDFACMIHAALGVSAR